jgi:hypothetical protein
MSKKKFAIITTATLVVLLNMVLSVRAYAKTERQITEAEIESWMRPIVRPREGLQGIYFRYKKIPKEKVPSWGHQIFWQAPGGLGGLLPFYDPADGGVYAKGTWEADQQSASADGVVYPNEVPTAYYKLGTANVRDGTITFTFPKGTTFTYIPPRTFDIGSNSIILKLPSVPPTVDMKRFESVQEQ